MIVEVQGQPFTGEGVVTRHATRTIIRDLEGNLVMFIIFLKDRRSMLVCQKTEEDFAWNAANHKIPMKLETQEIQLMENPSGPIVIR